MWCAWSGARPFPPGWVRPQGSPGRRVALREQNPNRRLRVQARIVQGWDGWSQGRTGSMATQAHAVAAMFVGSDVSKAALDMAMCPSREAWRGANAEAGSAELVGRLRPRQPQLIVLEGTGGLERLVVAALALAGLPAGR